MSSKDELKQLLQSLRTASLKQREEQEEAAAEAQEESEGEESSDAEGIAGAEEAPLSKQPDVHWADEADASGSEESAESSDESGEESEGEIAEHPSTLLGRLQNAASYRSSNSNLKQQMRALLSDPKNLSSSNNVKTDFAHLLAARSQKGDIESDEEAEEGAGGDGQVVALADRDLVHSPSQRTPYSVAGYFRSDCPWCQQFYPAYKQVASHIAAERMPENFRLLHINGNYGKGVPRVVFLFDGVELDTKDIETRDPVALQFSIEALYLAVYPVYRELPTAMRAYSKKGMTVTVAKFRVAVLGLPALKAKCERLMRKGGKHQGFLRRWINWFKMKLAPLLHGRAKKKCGQSKQ